jgi:predicted amidohydrolase
MIVALASPRVATSLDDGMENVRRLIADASARGAEIVCFPEAYLPGLRGVDIDVPPFEIATIMGMERLTDAGRQIVAVVFDAEGRVQGYQTKNQLAPSEDPFYVPGDTRRIFEVNGTRFGVVICHEGWRYPETVRWAAARGARIVFHPQHTGSNHDDIRLKEWGGADRPYYEKAMVMRSIENTIYFASVNYALRFPESATALIDPSGECQAYLPYGQEGVLVQSINPDEATGLIASRFAPARYQESFTPTER